MMENYLKTKANFLNQDLNHEVPPSIIGKIN